MAYLSLKVDGNYLVVCSCDKVINKSYVNTNIFNDLQLFYSSNYISKNTNAIVNILNNVCKSKNVDSIRFLDYECAKEIVPILIYLNDIINIYFDFNISIKKDIYSSLIKCVNIKYIECFYMPDGFVRQLGKNNISIKFTQNQKFRERFIRHNNLKSMNNMYYKRKIIVYKNTLTDFEKFLKINKSLRAVYIHDFSLEFLDEILDLIGERDISIYIEQDEDNVDIISNSIKELRKINKSYSNFSRDISIVYSKSYFKNNFFKQVNYNNIRLCSLIVIYIGIILLLVNKFNDYKSKFSINMINQTLVDNITETPEENNSEIVDITENGIEVIEEKEKYSDLPTAFNELKKINNETIGWLVVNNTKINYPVVKHSDNKYYLNHDFYKSRTSNGWIFMDYRNNPNDLDKNSILYGHSLLSKLLFGTLHNVLYSSWYKNKSNQIITFSTNDITYRFQIFSIYKIDETSDYLRTRFEDDNDFVNFGNMLKQRSIYDFGVQINPEDKIITLSTCSGSNKENKRLVVHAKLLYD